MKAAVKGQKIGYDSKDLLNDAISLCRVYR
jgi:hypothetical protein